MPSKIQALTVTASERVELLSVEPDTRPLEADEVTGPTVVSLISPGTELSYNYMGERFPNHPGYASIFRVAEAGADTGLKPGSLAFAMAQHRSVLRVRAKDVLPLPAGLAPEIAPFARLMGVSMTTLATTKARPGQRVLVTGLGIVGNLAAQLFQACNYDVYAVDPAPERRRLAAEVGIRNVSEKLSPPETSGGSAAEQGFALLVECSGRESAVVDALGSMRKGSEVVLVGVPWRKTSEASAHQLLHAVFHNYVQIRSGWEWELPRQLGDFAPSSIMENLRLALNWLSEGKVNVQGFAPEIAAPEAQAAYAGLKQGTWPGLTALLRWSRSTS